MNNSRPFFHRLVHLDLKGAAFKVSYYEQLLPFLRNIGATGILVEYEDTFPYAGDLADLRQPEAYSQECILHIQQIAKLSDLIVVPLVQTFGHLEFVLKLQKFLEFREISRYPNVLCPCHPRSLSLVEEMVSQVIRAHSDVQWFHLGADEVWHLGQCNRCRAVMAEEQWSKDHLFVDYVAKLAGALHKRYPNIGFIIWDDMMREMDPQVITGSGLNTLVEPMVWHYFPQSEFRLKQNLWEKYLAIFPNIWIASAYKGATKINQMLTPASFHISNHEAWNCVLMENVQHAGSFRGIALSGWQRFDHFTMLCELLPVAIPCLALCLKTIMERTGLTAEACNDVAQAIGHYGSIPLDVYPRPRAVPPAPNFPGGNLYVSVLHLANVMAELEQVLANPRQVSGSLVTVPFLTIDGIASACVQGGFHEYLVAHNRTNPLHVDQFINTARKIMNRKLAAENQLNLPIIETARRVTFRIGHWPALLVNVEALYRDITKELSEIYHQGTVEEWLSTNVSPCREKLKKLVSDADLQIAVNVPA